MRPFPDKIGLEILTDFLFNLPKTKNENSATLVAVDKLSKKIGSIPVVTLQITAGEVSESTYYEIFKHYGFPQKTTSDKN